MASTDNPATPLIIGSDDGVILFESIASARGYIEVPDVETGVYGPAFDAEGRLLAVEIPKVLFEPQPERGLRRQLWRVFRSFNPVEVRVVEDEPTHQAQLTMTRDGGTYTGYLWDFLLDKHPVTEDELWRLVDRASSDIYFMWDLHAVDRVCIPDYFKFPLGTVARTSPARLRGGMKYLPEDLYIFDQTMAWTGALTHEDIGEAQRYCVWSGDLPSTAT